MTIAVRYIGSKQFKTDNVNHTRTVWNGKGDVKPYPASLAAKLLYMHEDIWEIASGGQVNPPVQEQSTSEATLTERSSSAAQPAKNAVPGPENGNSESNIPHAHIRQVPPPGSSLPGLFALPDDWDLIERLSNEELGAYLRLTRKCAAGEPVEDDDDALAAAVGVEVSAFNEIRPAVARFFSIIGGRWRHRAIEVAIAAAIKQREARVVRGRNAARTRWGGKPATSER